MKELEFYSDQKIIFFKLKEYISKKNWNLTLIVIVPILAQFNLIQPKISTGHVWRSENSFQTRKQTLVSSMSTPQKYFET